MNGTTLRQLKIFLASPGDVNKERQRVRSVVNEINHGWGEEHGLVLRLFTWETDAAPEFGGDPQSLLNQQIAQMEEYDFFVGIMWNRFGTRTPRAKSGTEEEFQRAVKSLQERGKPDIMFYFCQKPSGLRSQTDLEQKGKVVAFKESLQSQGLYWEYKTSDDFERLFRKHLQGGLQRWISKHPIAMQTLRSTEPEDFRSSHKPLANDGLKTTAPRLTRRQLALVLLTSGGCIVLVLSLFYLPTLILDWKSRQARLPQGVSIASATERVRAAQLGIKLCRTYDFGDAPAAVASERQTHTGDLRLFYSENSVYIDRHSRECWVELMGKAASYEALRNRSPSAPAEEVKQRRDQVLKVLQRSQDALLQSVQAEPDTREMRVLGE